MPKSTRQTVHRGIERAMKDLKRAEDHIVQVGFQYKDHHPELYDRFCEVVNGADLLVRMLEVLKNKI